ncbi:MAG: cupin domain-containing protein [Spirosomataceae bacterium]
MKFSYPHTIQNNCGEVLIFKLIEHETDGDKVLLESFVQPDKGPVMHVHLLQDECITVASGKMGYQVLGKAPAYLEAGQSAFFERGTPHRFWNASNEVLHLTGWIKPAHSIVFFLSALYAAQAKSGSEQPEAFDGAYLVTRYKNEYDLPELPAFVKKVIMPLTYLIGKLLGKYKKFEDAPKPV